MDKILNLTQHDRSEPQIKGGVVEPSNKERVRALITFESLPSPGELARRAEELAALAEQAGAQTAMIGGAPYLQSALERALMARGIRPVYSFTDRQSVEEVNDEGQTVKRSVFVHAGFVDPVGFAYKAYDNDPDGQLTEEWIDASAIGETLPYSVHGIDAQSEPYFTTVERRKIWQQSISELTRGCAPDVRTP